MNMSAGSEFQAIKAVHDALEPLTEEGRKRVIEYLISFLKIDAKVAGSSMGSSEGVDREKGAAKGEGGQKRDIAFDTFAELHDAARPSKASEHVLVAGYWLQVSQGAENFNAAAANKELGHLGHRLTNVTNALDDLKEQSPALAIQLRKSGSSQQARKTYKITGKGIARVQEMING